MAGYISTTTEARNKSSVAGGKHEIDVDIRVYYLLYGVISLLLCILLFLIFKLARPYFTRCRREKTVDVFWQSPQGSNDKYSHLIVREIELAGGLELRLTSTSSGGQEQYYNRPVFVELHSVTRLAIDVNHALGDIKPSRMVVVVIVHNMAPHVEDQVADSRMMLRGANSMYSQLGLIVDLVVYDGRLSFYEKNRRSIAEVVQFISSFG